MSTEQCHERFISTENCDNVLTLRPSAYSDIWAYSNTSPSANYLTSAYIYIYIYFFYTYSIHLYTAIWIKRSRANYFNTPPDDILVHGIAMSSAAVNLTVHWEFKCILMFHYHNKCDDVANRRRIDCLLSGLFRGIWKKTSLCVTGLPCTKNQ